MTTPFHLQVIVESKSVFGECIIIDFVFVAELGTIARNFVAIEELEKQKQHIIAIPKRSEESD